MNTNHFTQGKRWHGAFAGLLGALALHTGAAVAADMPNACPVDGCKVELVDAKKVGDELELTFAANFTPDMAKNHIHVWWGENFTITQVSNNAETVHRVTQGEWEPTADYPTYTTSGVMSTGSRGEARTICVSASDRHHDILDVDALHCVNVSPVL